jgi:predicted dehydrogenase
LGDERIDAVVCVQQWPNNYVLVKQALLAGKSVISEKPMMGRLDEAEELAAIAREKGLSYTVGFMKRYDLGVELAQGLIGRLLVSDEIGPLRTVDVLCNGGDWLHNIEAHVTVKEQVQLPPLRPTYPDSCQTEKQRAAYGYLLNIFSHNINLCHYLLGSELNPRHVQFVGGKAMTADLRSGEVLVTMRGAETASPEWDEVTTLTFGGGKVIVKTPTPMHRQLSAEVRLLRHGKDGFSTTEYHVPAGWAFYRQAAGFIKALKGEEELHSSLEACVYTVRIMEKMIEIAEVL